MLTRLFTFLHDTIQIPSGHGCRRFIAGIMLIMGLGRPGFYSTKILANLLTPVQYGTLLVVFGLLLWINGHFRLSVPGRIIAALSAILMMTMAWDIGTLSVTALLEAWMALSLAKEAFTSS